MPCGGGCSSGRRTTGSTEANLSGLSHCGKILLARLEQLVLKVSHVDAHVPNCRTTEEHQNNHQVDQAAKIEVAQVYLDWQQKGELFIARWAHETSATKEETRHTYGLMTEGWT